MKNQFNVSILPKACTQVTLQLLAGKLILGLLPIAVLAEILLLILYPHR